MNLDIPADLQAFINQQVQTGMFASEQQVVAEGLRLLKVEREESLAGIRAGLADAAAGRLLPLHEAFAELRRELGIDATQ